MAIIETQALTKQYGDVTAVEELDLSVREGEIYGFLGHNGAGKTTTINMILDLVSPTEGTVSVFGQDLSESGREIRDRIGVLPAHSELYDRLTARKHLEFVNRVKDGEVDTDALLERVGILDAADRRAGEFSTGMGQRLKLAMALVGDPDLLILDEPTSGLDPNGARQMREIIQAENERGATVFFSSHIMGQVDAMCDRIGVMNEGTLVAEDTVDGIRTAATGDAELSVTVDGHLPRVAERVQATNGIRSVETEDETLRIALETASAKGEAMNAVAETDAQIRDFEVEEETLEDAFADLTQRKEVSA